MKRFTDWLLAVLVLRAGASARRDGDAGEAEQAPIVPPGEPSPRAELAVAVLLLLAAAGAVFFIVAYALDWSTQVLGGALGGTLAIIAVALIVTARHLIVTEEIAEEYPAVEDREAQRDVARIVRESGGRITRKKLLGGAAGVAGGALATAFVTPALSLGPAFDTSRLNESPWRSGRRLVDRDGTPISADDVEIGAFYTAFPEGADPEAIASPVVMVRLAPDDLALPPERIEWAPEGILAYSKICTHAGCAIALYRNPLFEPTEPSHALVCPCHYSTFDAGAAGKVLFGPAGRPLPQLPLMIGGDRLLRAAGNYSGPVGPSWWGVRGDVTSS
jgi:quinol---cytochrome c reductase iron-sulfur subunit